ncbi:MAG: hypothetical protein PHT07_15630 [Paludibacter sp.]|nr:hypothetical protein [Paludibacter sp.]
MITKVTITGADDSISPSALLPLNDKYPFVEWGILVSQRRFGTNRYPSTGWVSGLVKMKRSFPEVKLSCHLCGKFVRELVAGNTNGIADLDTIWNIFDRIQINFHAIRHTVHKSMIDVLKLFPEKEFIFQYDDVNNFAVHFAHESGIKCSALFDASGGAGILPENWPEPLNDIKCGYAGGISPENIEKQIQLIQGITGDRETWIDMETHVRSDNDMKFDLVKVEQCLEISSIYINNNTL